MLKRQKMGDRTFGKGDNIELELEDENGDPIANDGAIDHLAKSDALLAFGQGRAGGEPKTSKASKGSGKTASMGPLGSGGGWDAPDG